MHRTEVVREHKQATVSVVLTVLGMVFVVAVYFWGPRWALLVGTLGFMAGYIVERRRLSRTLQSLLQQVGSQPPSEGVSWPA